MAEVFCQRSLEANTFEKIPYDEEDILTAIAQACFALNRWPSPNDLRLYGRQHPGFPSTTTIEKRFPKRVLLVEAMREWSLESKNYSYAAVADMLPVPVEKKLENRENLKFGHVYLLRAGEYYKIGQSADLEKRVKAINVALPDKATLDHAIATDDPSGIEAYWHRRFADRRMNGEWFKLSKSDVLAFKRRKFQ
ncbi:MAG: GIY-YIG nuclease family protein [Sphingomonadales bacterium]|jgi:hypothetical protein|nr:GIY-YIG nuclease family protein [Sphingomonadales bacterium]